MICIFHLMFLRSLHQGSGEGHVARIGNLRNAYIILFIKSLLLCGYVLFLAFVRVCVMSLSLLTVLSKLEHN